MLERPYNSKQKPRYGSRGNGCRVIAMLSASSPVVTRRMAVLIWFMYKGTL